MHLMKNYTYKALCVALALALCAGLATVSYARDIDIPIGDLVNPTDPPETSEPEVFGSGSYGALSWVLYSSGLLEISGTGAMPEERAPWLDDCGLIQEVQIGEGVTTVCAQAFLNCDRIESVQLPQGLESIGYGAFVNCRSLNSISIPETVTTIEAVAFGACTGLESIELPAGITQIQERTFVQCTALSTVTIKDKVETIGVGAFSGCSSLRNVYYYGDESEWASIAVAGENYPLLNAQRFYNVDEVLRGDMNGDHQVNDADALYLLRYTLFPARFPINQSGDVNGDGSENDADALYLLRHTLFPSRFPLK